MPTSQVMNKASTFFLSRVDVTYCLIAVNDMIKTQLHDKT